MCDSSGEPRDILLITADAVEDNRKVSFKFMIDADPERKLSPMPSKYGYIWSDKDTVYAFDVFEGGKGLIVGGGWTKHSSSDWEKQMLDALPSCTLLMDIALLPWWEALTEKHGVEFRRHHHEGVLTTS